MPPMFFLMTSATFIMTPSTFIMTFADAEGHLPDTYRSTRASAPYVTSTRVIRYEPLSTPPTVAMTIRQGLGMKRK